MTLPEVVVANPPSHTAAEHADHHEELHLRFNAVKTLADGFTVANHATLRTLDANSYTPDELADFVCTLIADWQAAT